MSNGAPIEFYNRYTGQVEREDVYGESYLRWTYETACGRALLGMAVRRAAFSRWFGWRMGRPKSRSRIAPFIEQYKVPLGDMDRAPEAFESFNDFFSRPLKEGARPIDARAEAVVFGADGRHLGFPDVTAASGIFVKGQSFSLESLLGSAELASRYRHGTLVLSRLCPVDYHRFHFPLSGTPGKARLIEGHLYSVSPIALRRRLEYFCENKRMITELDTPQAGKVLILEVGATCVGTIVQTFVPGLPVEKGAEKGMFRFGGSACVTLFEPGRVKLAEDLVRNSEEGREVYAHMGDTMALIGAR